MRPKIDYRYITPNTDEMQKMQLFAESFDHKITPNPSINVHSFNRGDICFGYADIVYVPVAYPAFHPLLTKPHDVIQVMNDYRAHSQFAGKPMYIGVPTPDHPGRSNFPESIMNKLGLIRMNRELYLPS